MVIIAADAFHLAQMLKPISTGPSFPRPTGWTNCFDVVSPVLKKGGIGLTHSRSAIRSMAHENLRRHWF